MADDTATAKPKKSDDPIGDLISNKTKPTSDNSAADGSNALAMLVRRDSETLPALLKRLDRAIAAHYDDGSITDEVNAADD